MQGHEKFCKIIVSFFSASCPLFEVAIVLPFFAGEFEDGGGNHSGRA